jgi:hypothetical protein
MGRGKGVDQCADAWLSSCERRTGSDKEVDQLQARWLHALSCLVVLTGRQTRTPRTCYDAASAAYLYCGGGMIRMAPRLFWLNADKLVSLQVCRDLR